MSVAIDLVTLTQPRSAAADAYRTLRTNLLFSNLDTPLRTLCVTSPAEENQKGLAAANLAVTFAQSERRTLLIDADLRRPMMHEIFGVPQNPGLTTALLEGGDTVAGIVATEVEGLSVLPSGELPANTVDVLASERMARLVQGLMQNADVLIFHTPPVLVGADAMVLGQRLDGTILVTQAGKTRRDHTARAKEQLERVHINLLGAVLLDAATDRTSTQYR
jgi:capsular exopolysaccharide synthesis family protein